MPWRSPLRGADSAVGIYDRDYYREEPRGVSLFAPRSVVTKIIIVNVVVWLADFFTPGHWLSNHLAVHIYTLTQPWLWWQYLTAGFAHSPIQFQHILFNMLALFFFGHEVEEVYGGREFLRLYLVMVVFASVLWNVLNLGTPADLGVDVAALGASGAIAGVVVLYALNFPRRTVLLFFVIPIPAWLFGVIVVVMDMMGAFGGGATAHIAYSMHLAGAAFAFIYFQRRWNLTRLTEGLIRWPTFRRRPRLRVHDPEQQQQRQQPPSDLSEEVDRILEKIYRQGEASLTAKERQTLEAASREYQRRVKVGGGKGK